MESVVADGIEVDRCTRCEGLWFDAGELEWLARDGFAETIDVGTAEEGRDMNALIEIDCPRCGRAMQHVADRYKPQIRYEVCGECRGVFLDAGEFRELARLSIAELFRALFVQDPR